MSARKFDRWFISWIAIVTVAVLVPACGPAEDSSSQKPPPPSEESTDPAGSAARVETGKTLLIDVLAAAQVIQTDPTTEAVTVGFQIPFAALADQVSPLFDEAALLDPQNDEARFFAAVAKVLIFLGGAETRNFLTRAGWADLREPGEAESVGGAFLASLSGLMGGTFSLPVPDGSPVLLGGTRPDALAVAEILDYFTGSLPAALGRSVDLLAGIQPGFSTSISFVAKTVDQSGQVTSSTHSFEIDEADARMLQALFGTLRSVLLMPALYRYPGVDELIEANRDPADPTLVSIPNEVLRDYFALGLDGVVASGDEPLAANPGGIKALKGALAGALQALDSTITTLSAEQDAQGDDLVPRDIVFDLFAPAAAGGYDAKSQVVAYYLQPYLRTVREMATSLGNAGGNSIGLYEPVAFIRDWEVCDPVAGGTPDLTPGNVPGLLTAVDAETPVAVAMDAAGGAAPTPAALSPTDQRYYFTFTVSAAQNLSIFTRQGGGNTTDTRGEVAYASGTVLTSWDTDEDSGEGGHFGISIAATDFGAPGGLPLPSVEMPVVFYVAVGGWDGSGQPSGDFNLYVWSDATAGTPIFLKGGGGRNFRSAVYRLASLQIDLGQAVEALGGFWDSSQRGTLGIGDSSTVPPVDWSLQFPTAALRGMVQGVFPATVERDLVSMGLGDAGEAVDLFTLASSFSPGGLIVEPAPVGVTAAFPGAPDFCAYPRDLGPARAYEGGFSPVFLPF